MKYLERCIYDNPKTLCREFWTNGRILYAYSKDGDVYSEAGVWKAGRIIGDPNAIHPDYRPNLDDPNITIQYK